jgi:hypothetical protein
MCLFAWGVKAPLASWQKDCAGGVVVPVWQAHPARRRCVGFLRTTQAMSDTRLSRILWPWLLVMLLLCSLMALVQLSVATPC